MKFVCECGSEATRVKRKGEDIKDVFHISPTPKGFIIKCLKCGNREKFERED